MSVSHQSFVFLEGDQHLRAVVQEAELSLGFVKDTTATRHLCELLAKANDGECVVLHCTDYGQSRDHFEVKDHKVFFDGDLWEED